MFIKEGCYFLNLILDIDWCHTRSEANKFNKGDKYKSKCQFDSIQKKLKFWTNLISDDRLTAVR